MFNKHNTMNELYRCYTCQGEKKAVSIDVVPEEHKASLMIMMEAMESSLQPKTSALIVYCKKCNQYSTVLIDDW